MAQHSGGDFLKWGLLIGGGYLLYRTFFSSSSSSSAPFSLQNLIGAVTGSPSPGSTPPAGGAPITLQHLTGSPILRRAPDPIAAVPVSTTSPVLVAPVDPATVTALINAAGTDSLDADQWNFYFSQLSHVEQTADLFPPGDRSALMSASDYVNARASAGLPTSLLQGVSGLGALRVPVPLMFALGRDGQPVMFLPPRGSA